MRPNISYSIYARKKKDIVPAVAREIERIRIRGGGQDRILVFTRTINDCNDFASTLRGLPYHSRVSTKDQIANVEKFRDGSVDLLVATTSFGIGVDISNIRECFHIHSPFTLNNFRQESGRIGRDGQPAEARIFFDFEDSTSSSAHLLGKDPIYDLLRLRNTCIRGYLTSIYDGGIAQCCHLLDDVNPCQFCLGTEIFSSVAEDSCDAGNPINVLLLIC